MKRFGLAVLILAMLLIAGCAGNSSTPNKTGGKAANDKAAVAVDAPVDDSAAGDSEVVEKPAAEPDADSKQPAAGAGVGAGEDGAPAGAGVAEKSPGSTGPKITLWVTRDYAHQELYGGEVTLNRGESVMDVLKKNLKVTTQYGGGFVESINGLSSGYTGEDKKTRDWFYYVNGIIPSEGAMDYQPAPGDVIWWDYHDWGGAVFTPALIGAFPKPFVSGYRGDNPGTVVLAAAGCERQGNKLAAYLRHLGVKNVETRPYSEKTVVDSDKITLVVGLWEHLAGEGFWQGLQKQRKKTGLCIEFSPDYFATLNMNGAVVDRYHENVGAIVATGAGVGDSTPVWLVTGLDQAGLDGAVKTFTEKPGTIKQHFGAVVTNGKVIAVPK